MTTLATKWIGDRLVSLVQCGATTFAVSMLDSTGDGAWFFESEAEARTWYAAFTPDEDDE